MFEIQKKVPNFGNSIITITRTIFCDNARKVNVYFNVFSIDNKVKNEDFIKFLNKNKKSIRFKLGQKIGKSVRIIPEISFYIDNNIQELLKYD